MCPGAAEIGNSFFFFFYCAKRKKNLSGITSSVLKWKNTKIPLSSNDGTDESVFIDQWETWCKGYAVCVWVCVWMGVWTRTGAKAHKEMSTSMPSCSTSCITHSKGWCLTFSAHHRCVHMLLTHNNEHTPHLRQELGNYPGLKHVIWTSGSIPSRCTNRSMRGLWRRYEFWFGSSPSKPPPPSRRSIMARL